MLLSCGKESGTLTNQMVSAMFLQLINGISTERDSTFLASLYKYFSESLRVIGGPEALSPQFHEGIIKATKRQLHTLADKRKARAVRPSENVLRRFPKISAPPKIAANIGFCPVCGFFSVDICTDFLIVLRISVIIGNRPLLKSLYWFQSVDIRRNLIYFFLYKKLL